MTIIGPNPPPPSPQPKIYSEKDTLRNLKDVEGRLKYLPTNKSDSYVTIAHEVKFNYDSHTSLISRFFNKIWPFRTDQDKINILYQKIRSYESDPKPEDRKTIEQAKNLGFLGGNDIKEAKRFLDNLVSGFSKVNRQRTIPLFDQTTSGLWIFSVNKEKALSFIEKESFNENQEFVQYLLDNPKLLNHAMIDYLAKGQVKIELSQTKLNELAEVAINDNNKHLLRFLINKGIDIQAPINVGTGETLLHLAVKQRKLEIADLLLVINPKLVSIPDKSGIAPFELAWKKQDTDSLELLLRMGEPDIEHLLEKKVDEYSQYSKGPTYLALAHVLAYAVKFKKTIDFSKMDPDVKENLLHWLDYGLWNNSPYIAGQVVRAGGISLEEIKRNVTKMKLQAKENDPAYFNGMRPFDRVDALIKELEQAQQNSSKVDQTP